MPLVGVQNLVYGITSSESCLYRLCPMLVRKHLQVMLSAVLPNYWNPIGKVDLRIWFPGGLINDDEDASKWEPAAQMTFLLGHCVGYICPYSSMIQLRYEGNLWKEGFILGHSAREQFFRQLTVTQWKLEVPADEWLCSSLFLFLSTHGMMPPMIGVILPSSVTPITAMPRDYTDLHKTTQALWLLF